MSLWTIFWIPDLSVSYVRLALSAAEISSSLARLAGKIRPMKSSSARVASSPTLSPALGLTVGGFPHLHS